MSTRHPSASPYLRHSIAALDILLLALLAFIALSLHLADSKAETALWLLLPVVLLRSALTFLVLRALAWRARHDETTRLPNRHLFHERLTCLLRHHPESPAAVLLINVDRFKLFIGSLGYLLCDDLLKAVARRFTEALIRRGVADARLYRFEADTFAVLASEKTPPESLAEALIEALHQPIYVNHRECCVTVSVGFSLSPEDGQTADTLLHAADLALQQAKKRGGNTWRRYHPKLEPRRHPLILEGYLRHALEYDELELYYQPQIRLDDRALCGAEVTLRWHHPQYRLIPPGEFIPLAEEAGLIAPITVWLMHRALRQLQIWQRQHRPIRLAINVSAYQFHQQDLPHLIKRLLSEYRIDPRWLELEITESAAMLDIDHTAKILHQLKRLGIQLALDDFGTGFSSLNYLRRFPLHTLKVDQSFIRPIEKSPGNTAIVKGIISLGRSLHLKTLAEGIETPGQLAALQRMGCDEGQGYLFGKPMPAQEFERMLHRPRTPAGIFDNPRAH
ncbi:putative bifunctional diguanylate cyclase/phosphodiesterase [Methylohalobius crimeensis]|uniref:putative bifunctional diguanylate cyclase/phosphodiesterase n=1 Tax=Methylohalobius crimeensis TaxID=244365 RepID=UPI0003B71DB5|nr:bifunctional diguanylate cyclase/phosphodiesterase [Methylohalobius crimeensis]